MNSNGIFQLYTPAMDRLVLYPEAYSIPMEYSKIKDFDLLRSELFHMYNMPWYHPINIGCVKLPGDKNKGETDLSYYDNNAKFELPHKKTQIYNTHDYSKITESISNRIIIAYNNLMGFCPEENDNAKIIAYHYRYIPPTNVVVTPNQIIKMISDMNNHFAKQYIVCSQTMFEWGMQNPSIHFIISNACSYFGNRKKMNYIFSENVEPRIQRIGLVFLKRVYNEPVDSLDY